MEKPITLSPEVLAALSHEMPQQQPNFIITSTNYHNQDGLRIEEFKLIDGVLPADFPRFVAHAVATVDLPTQPGQPPRQHRQPISVPVPAESVQEAFANAGEHLQKASESFHKQFEEDMKGRLAQANLRQKLTQGLRG